MVTKKIRRTVYILLSFFTIGASTVSCKKNFLEIIPKGITVAKSYEDYNLLMNNDNFYAYSRVGIWQAAMMMGDDVSGEESLSNQPYLQQTKALFQWDDDVFVPLSSRIGADNPLFLQRLLQNLYPLNKIISECPAAQGGTEQQKRSLVAEAMATRAFTNFQLINYFAKPYSSGTAANDPGFPMITSLDITATDFPRGTVQQMYDFIIKDMTTAIEGLNIQPAYPTRWSKAAAEGFLGKVYLFMGKHTEALNMFNASFSDLGKLASPPKLYDYNVTFAANGSFLPIDVSNGPNSPFNNITDLTESVIAIFSYSGFNDGNNFGNDFLTIDNKTKALFGSGDLRLNLFTNLQNDQTLIPGGRIRRYTGQFAATYARIGLEMPELYLLRAEARARSNDLAGAVSDVETLRKNRMPADEAAVPIDIANNQTALIRFIIEERNREFAGLGYRWWDMRRLSNDPIFSAQPPATHTLYLTSGGTKVYTLKAQRLTLRFPQVYLRGNPGMTDNP